MCNMQALVTNGLLRMAEDGEIAEETLTFKFNLSSLSLVYLWADIEFSERKEHQVFEKLLQMMPHLTERLMAASDEEAMTMADFVCP